MVGASVAWSGIVAMVSGLPVRTLLECLVVIFILLSGSSVSLFAGAIKIITNIATISDGNTTAISLIKLLKTFIHSPPFIYLKHLLHTPYKKGCQGMLLPLDNPFYMGYPASERK
jgi:hypothetical protein